MAAGIARVVGLTLIGVGLVLALAVPVWVNTDTGVPFRTCAHPGVIGAYDDESDNTPDSDYGERSCRAGANARLYHVTPWIVIGLGALGVGRVLGVRREPEPEPAVDDTPIG
jgi:hypothetical protein